MGYTTEFQGEFILNKTLDNETKDFLTNLAGTRRMARKLPSEYGIEGEFYVKNTGDYGQTKDDTIIDYNRPPKTQPGLWCQWVPNQDGTAIEWDCGEKFYNYVEWLEYIIDKILAPKGYVLNGAVMWRGEDFEDIGVINVNENKVSTKGLL